MRLRLLSCLPIAALLALAPASPAAAQGRRLRKETRDQRRQDREDRKEQRESGQAKLAVHGGKLVEASGHVFEVVLLEDAIRVYATREGEPVELKGASAKVTIGIVRRDQGKRANHQTSSASLSYAGVSASKGRLRGCLVGSHKLGQADRQAITLAITISRVPKVKGAVAFEVSGIGASQALTYACASCQGKGSKKRYFDPGTCPECKQGQLAPEQAGQAEGGEAGQEGKKPGWGNRR